MKREQKKELLLFIIAIIIGVACVGLLIANADRIDRTQKITLYN